MSNALNKLLNITHPVKLSKLPSEYGGIITIIGPKNSGKTTYLAGLAYWPTRRTQEGRNSPYYVYPSSPDARKLRDEAEDKILQGLYLEPSELPPSFDELPEYIFKIEIKARFWKPESITLAVRDYPGEIYKKLSSERFDNLPTLERRLIDECLKKDVKGCLILLDKWELGADAEYERAMLNFIQRMDQLKRLRGENSLRIAVAMSKCERGELWPGRIDPETDIFNTHLPATTDLLRRSIPKNNLKFFAISTFGVLKSNDPRPNRKVEIKVDPMEGTVYLSVLNNKNQWQPYGMISPLYWLSKGKGMRQGV